MKNPQFADEYNTLGPEYEIIEQVIRARAEKGLTQKQLAEITGIPQANISRIENGKSNPLSNNQNGLRREKARPLAWYSQMDDALGYKQQRIRLYP